MRKPLTEYSTRLFRWVQITIRSFNAPIKIAANAKNSNTCTGVSIPSALAGLLEIDHFSVGLAILTRLLDFVWISLLLVDCFPWTSSSKWALCEYSRLWRVILLYSFLAPSIAIKRTTIYLSISGCYSLTQHAIPEARDCRLPPSPFMILLVVSNRSPGDHVYIVEGFVHRDPRFLRSCGIHTQNWESYNFEVVRTLYISMRCSHTNLHDSSSKKWYDSPFLLPFMNSFVVAVLFSLSFVWINREFLGDFVN